MSNRGSLILAAVAALALGGTTVVAQVCGPRVTVLASGLRGGAGSAIGPDGALYATEWELGRISRVDLRTGRVTPYAWGLPPGLPDFPYTGVFDVAFIGRTLYALVTLVGEDVGGHDICGVYRMDGPGRWTVIADLGAWSIAHPPNSPYEVPTGATFALEPFHGGLLVTDSHHNRVLWVSLQGAIREVATFGNVAPAGMAVRGNLVYVAQAGPIPHRPEDGKVVVFGPHLAPTVIASGTRLPVDVEFGPGDRLYAVTQGRWEGVYPGDPALPNAGSLLKVNANGTYSTLVFGLDQPSSLEIVGRTAYVVTLTGNVLRIVDAF